MDFMEFRVYNKKTFAEVSDWVKMDAKGAFFLNGEPLNRDLFFVEWLLDAKFVRGDGDWKTFRDLQEAFSKYEK